MASNACSRVGGRSESCDVSGTPGTLAMICNRVQVCEALSRVGNFLAIGLPHPDLETRNALKTSIQSPMSREMALVAYRNLLRSARLAFQGESPRGNRIQKLMTCRRHERTLCRTRRSPEELRIEPPPHSRKRRAIEANCTCRGGGQIPEGECGSGTSSRHRGQL
jgi:hypothetical protein